MVVRFEVEFNGVTVEVEGDYTEGSKGNNLFAGPGYEPPDPECFDLSRVIYNGVDVKDLLDGQK